MNMDGTTLALFFLSPRLVAGPQKPQTLTMNILDQKFIFLIKNKYSKNVNFFTPKNTTLKIHDLKKFQFTKFYLT